MVMIAGLGDGTKGGRWEKWYSRSGDRLAILTSEQGKVSWEVGVQMVKIVEFGDR